MYWRFGFNNASTIESVFHKENVTLDDILQEEELLQECKAQNPRLIDFLLRPDVLTQLLMYTIAEDLDDEKKSKFPYVACEVLSFEESAICEAIVSNAQLMATFWTFLDRPAPLNPLHASYFSRVNSILLQKKTADMIVCIRQQPNVVQKLLIHIGTSAIADLVLKLISVDELPEGAGVVNWLSQEGLIPNLVGKLDPNFDADIHNTAAQTLLDIIAVSYQTMTPPEQISPEILNQMGGNVLVDELKNEAMMTKMVLYMLENSAPNSTSSLANGINIIIELIRRYCSEIEQAEFQQHQYQLQQSQGARPVLLQPSNEKLQMLAIDLNELLHVILDKVTNLAKLLKAPRNLKGPVDTTMGKKIPLGSERLKTCELFAEVLHLQYLYTSSPLFDRLVVPPRSGDNSSTNTTNSTSHTMPNNSTPIRPTRLSKPFTTVTVADELVLLTELFVEAKVLPECLELFFVFPWNNFLHSVVYDMIAKVFNTYSFTTTYHVIRSVSTDESATAVEEGSSAEGPLSVEARMQTIKNSVRKLVISILKDGFLTQRIVQAQRQNDGEVEQPKGVRLGYMGHLTYIAEEVIKLIDKCGQELNELREFVAVEDWVAYVSGPLKDTKERDREPLGGMRPPPVTHGMAVGPGGFGHADDGEGAISTRSDTFRSLDDDDELDAGGLPSKIYGTHSANEQFARYLVQQTVNDLPDRVLGVAESIDDEDVDWMGEFDAQDADFDMRDNGDPGNTFPHKESIFGDEYDIRTKPTIASISITNNTETPPLSNVIPSSSNVSIATWTADFSNAPKVSPPTAPTLNVTSFDITELKAALEEPSLTGSPVEAGEGIPTKTESVTPDNPLSAINQHQEQFSAKDSTSTEKS